ncbi:MAG: OmpH family outer membrane protein [candidate division WOR-3 bacterium]|nr:OmpH family outer membrane protein [candidate division WOR-3 bacterium]MDW8150403.1 OmpH family outer membrane protein [candidate division WOR-3 bacterium]
MLFIIISQKLNFAFVEMEKIKNNYYDYKDAINQLRQFQVEKEKQLDSLKKIIDSLKNSLSQQKVFLSEDGIRSLEKRIEEKEIEYQNLTKNIYQQIEQKYQQLVVPYINRIYEVIDSIARRNNYDLVLNKSSKEIILYLNSANDITDAIIAELNKGYNIIASKNIKYIGIFALKLNTKTSKLRDISNKMISIMESEIRKLPDITLISTEQTASIYNKDDPTLDGILKSVSILQLDAFIWGNIEIKENTIYFKFAIYSKDGKEIYSRTGQSSDKEEEWSKITSAYIKDIVNKYKEVAKQ